MQVAVVRPPCPCPACVAGKKIVNQAELARHFGIAPRELRAFIADGLPGYRASSRKFPRYSIEVADNWWHTQGQRGAA